jgi:hypothetical protein
MPYTIARPSPAPCAGPFVVKKGSNAWVRVVSSMPLPVSSTSIVTYGPGATSRIAAAVKSNVVLAGANGERAAAQHGIA